MSDSSTKKSNKSQPAGNDSKELEELKAEREEYLNGWKRAKADLINYKKEEAKRFQEVAKYSSESLIRDLIAVLDSFELGLVSMERNGGADKGIYIIKSQLEDILRKQGLEKIKISPGDAFDPNFHESLGEMESNQSSGAIVVEVEAGYILNGKVVRPTRVKLAK